MTVTGGLGWGKALPTFVSHPAPLPSERGSEHGGLDTPLAPTATVPDGLRKESEGMEEVERG